MFIHLVLDNLGFAITAAIGIFVGAVILVDLVVTSRRKWEPMQVDRGTIVEPKGGRNA
ncbi:hypothetical protein [Gordonia soli]|uniref:Uncharacterized protein n=1 Tax=Gordonia soli NBRC 108243 TaxID=1223545 RepID=M0QRI0_9ACTN|nr:hypothetical protein [Gordonia soli]GAC71089.1 hypothetical protein GS4_51_00270 [Gordonia soli NBRC 108243]